MKAPVVVNWLLNRLIAGAQAEAIVGDLLEQWRGGRSQLWFGRQMLAALVICIWREVYTHKMVSMSGILIGMLSLWCFAALMALALSSIGLLVYAVDWRWPHYIQLFSIAFVYAGASGWIVRRLHPAHRTAAVSAFCVRDNRRSVAAPLYYAIAPSIFFSTILPHLPFFLIAGLFGAPAILFGGLSVSQTVAD
jgi:hypothetical protein